MYPGSVHSRPRLSVLGVPLFCVLPCGVHYRLPCQDVVMEDPGATPVRGGGSPATDDMLWALDEAIVDVQANPTQDFMCNPCTLFDKAGVARLGLQESKSSMMWVTLSTPRRRCWGW